MRTACFLLLAAASAGACSTFGDGTPPAVDGGDPAEASTSEASTEAGAPDTAAPDGGCPKGGMYFDGVASKIEITYAAPLELNGELTIEAWIRPSGDAAGSNGIEMHVLSNHDYAERTGWLLALERGRVRFRLHGTGGDSGILDVGESGAPYVVGDRWAHVAATFDGGRVARVFYDGKQMASVTAPTGFTRQAKVRNVYIGRSAGSTQTHYTGVMRDVRLGSTALHAAPFTPPRPPLPVVTGTVALFRLDEATGNAAVDATGMHTVEQQGTDTSKHQDTECIP